jgi:hypothetical protein
VCYPQQLPSGHLVEVGCCSKSEKLQASCDMSTIAFYFLLRIGEYTKQFRACDIIFYDSQDNIIPNTARIQVLHTATTAIMRITNQKNGTRGSRISHHLWHECLPHAGTCMPGPLHHEPPRVHQQRHHQHLLLPQNTVRPPLAGWRHEQVN